MDDELRDEIERAVDDPGYYVDHDVLGYNGLEHSTDAVMVVVERRIAQARAETAEQILTDSVIQAAEKHNSGEFRTRRVVTFIANFIRGEIDKEVGSDE